MVKGKDLLRIRTPTPRQPAPLFNKRATGGYEMAHSFVCTGCVSWTDVECCSRKEPLVFPPRQMSNVDAEHIAAALLFNLEQCLFGSSILGFLAKLAKHYRVLHICLVGDAATGNRKVVAQLFHLLTEAARQHNVVLTLSWNPCLLHQCARILLLQLEQRQLSAALYSITRLHQHSNTRAKTSESMRRLLTDRFDYRDNEPPPPAALCFANNQVFRGHLFRLLSELGAWDGENADTPLHFSSERSHLLQQLLQFFNGDITQSEKWTHHCQGCHRNKKEAIQEVSGLMSKDVSVFSTVGPKLAGLRILPPTGSAVAVECCPTPKTSPDVSAQ